MSIGENMKLIEAVKDALDASGIKYTARPVVMPANTLIAHTVIGGDQLDCIIICDEKDEIIVFTQSIAGIFKSTDLGKTYRKVFEGSVTFNTSAMQSYVKKFGMDYYIAIPGHGVLQTQDFEKFETLFTEPNIDGLYIDHTGSIAVMGWLDKLNTSFFYGRK